MKTIYTLERIFGGLAKVKIMRLFLFNPLEKFYIDDVRSRAKVTREKARKELEGLVKIKMLRRKRLKGKSSWSLNNTFSYIKPLREFLVGMGIIKSSDVAERLKKAGQIKLLIISGVFVHDFDSRVDLLVVGDKLKKRSLDS